MADVFISYKKEDRAAVERVANALAAEGLTVWWDDDLVPRTAWDATIEAEIAAAGTVLVLWTPRSVSSEWVRIEAHYGQDRGKLVPAMMEECSIPLAFTLRQTVRLCDWDGSRENREWRRLLTWIVDLTSTKLGNANIPQNLGAAQYNRFRDAIGHLASGDPIVDGAFVNAATPAATAFRDGEAMPVMRIVPRGAFLLGSPANDPDRSAVEGPQKRIEIPGPFAIGVFPVLVSEYLAAIGSFPVDRSAPPTQRGGFLERLRRPKPATALRAATARPPLLPSMPMTDVSFDDAQAFAAALCASTGERYRLPSEAEWEYACRAGSRSRYSVGESIEHSNAVFGAGIGPAAPGAFAPNAFGLYDMHGNVREWTADLWHESFEATPLDGSAAIEGHGAMRVIRGGGWFDTAPLLRSATRMRATQTTCSNVIGFRVVRELN